MLNLIRRDLILQKKQLYIFIPYILFFVYVGSPAFLTCLIASIFIPFNAFTYDEKAETNILLNSLPYTRGEIIAAKYIGAIVYMLLSIALTCVMMLVFGKSFVWTDLAIASGLFMLMAAFTFPLFQILKPGYIGLTIVIGFVSTVLLSRLVLESYSENVNAVLSFFDRYPFSTLFTVSTIIVLCLYALSWILSTTIYRRKAF